MSFAFLPPLSTYAVFVVAAVAIILAPGPDTLFVLAQGVGDSRSAGVRAALGVASGVLVHTTLVALGLAALLRAWPTAFEVVKYAGAAYLVFLGVSSLRGGEFSIADGGGETGRAYRRGVTVNVLNPKVALFFLAFLPEFAGPGPDVTVRLFALGATYSLITACYLSVVGLTAGRARAFLVGDRGTRAVEIVSGVTVVCLGVAVALG